MSEIYVFKRAGKKNIYINLENYQLNAIYVTTRRVFISSLLRYEGTNHK